MKRINQHTEADGYMSLTISQFMVDESFSLTNDSFFKSLNSSIRPSQVKKGFGELETIKEGYLKGLFIGGQLNLDDFRFIPNDSIIYYLDGFSESVEEWGEDKQIFKGLLRKLSDKLSESIQGTYLLNREWFDGNSLKVRSREYSIYDFYLILVWEYDLILNICEWSAD